MMAVGNYVVTTAEPSEGLGVWCDAKFPFNRAKRQQCKMEKAQAKAEKKAERYASVTDMLGPRGGEIPWLPLFGGVAALIVGIYWWRSRGKKAA